MTNPPISCCQMVELPYSTFIVLRLYTGMLGAAEGGQEERNRYFPAAIPSVVQKYLNEVDLAIAAQGSKQTQIFFANGIFL